MHRRVRYVRSQAEFEALFTNTAATGDGPRPDLVGYGDTHDPFYECQLAGRTAFNTGAVGNCMGDPTPLYCILEGVLDSAEPAPWSIAYVRVPYDVEAELAAARELGMPAVRRLRARAAPRHLPRSTSTPGVAGEPRDRLPRAARRGRVTAPLTAAAARALVGADYTYDARRRAARPRGRTTALGAQRDHPRPAPYGGRLAARDAGPAVPAPDRRPARGRRARRCPAWSTRWRPSGSLEHSGGEVAALVDCRPYAADDRDLWVLSDLTPGLDGSPIRVGADHVLGISPASTSLAQLTLRRPVGRALDLGTGCGVQALHLAQHSAHGRRHRRQRRARCWLTRLNAELNEVDERRRARRLAARAGRRRAVRPDRDQPAVRHQPARRRPAGLPRQRPARRRGRRADRARRARPPRRPAAGCRCSPTGRSSRDQPWDERLGGWLRRRLRRAGRAARGARPGVVRRAVAQGRGPARRAPTTSTATTRGSAGSTSRASRASASAGSTCAHARAAADPPAARLAVRRRAADRAGDRGVGRRGRRCCAGSTTRPARRAPGRGAGRPAGDRRRCPARPTPRRSCCASSAGCAGRGTADTVVAGLVGACDGDLTTGQMLDALATLLARDPADELRDGVPPGGRGTWSRRASSPWTRRRADREAIDSVALP